MRELVMWAFVCIIFSIVAVIVVDFGARNADRKAAIASGVARYVADPQTGDVELVYGCPTTEVPNE